MTPERLQSITKVIDCRQNDFCIVLENVADPHNISAVMRSCDAVGIQNIYIVNTRIPQHKKFGDKSSSSANKWVSVHSFTTINACLNILRQQIDCILCAHLDDSAQSLYALDFNKKIALVFGNETSGISKEMQEACDGSFIIPQVGMIKSLNISVACAVSIYEAYRQKNILQHYATPKLNQIERKILFDEWAYGNKLQ